MALSMALTCWQCKPARTSGSSVKSLDNLAANANAALATHACGLSFDGRNPLPPSVAAFVRSPQITGSDLASRNAVVGTLAAVPESLRQMFFSVFQGQIQVGDALSDCRAAPFKDSQKPLLNAKSVVSACWLTAANGQPLRFVLNPDVSLIQSSLVRLFAYWESEFLIQGILRPNIPAPFDSSSWQTYAQGFIAERGALASAFLNDLGATAGSDLAALTAYNSADPGGFGDLVYANAVDSYYCSTPTRNAFQESFKSTWAAFNDQSSGFAPAKELGEPSAAF